MKKILIRYAEIGLKGGNLNYFENKLVKNIKLALGGDVTLEKLRKQFVVALPDSKLALALESLKKVFGIAWFAEIHETNSNLEDISKRAIKLIGRPKSFAIRASRSDKRLPFSSQDIAVKVGSLIQTATNAKVDLKNPATSIYITAGKDKTFLYTNKFEGSGGLPVGTSGKVLSLLSGGFDSIAASYLLAKRGAQVDYLHFHIFNDHKKVLDSKIQTIVNKLSDYTLSQTIHLASYSPFQMNVLGLDRSSQPHELILFRRLMARVGEELADKLGYQTLVFGDSLGQVASQTMENIVAVDQAVDIPILRPLIGMDKKSIIKLVQEIDLETESIQPYQDCCSLVSKTPATKANPEKISALEEKININQITHEIVKQTKTISL